MEVLVVELLVVSLGLVLELGVVVLEVLELKGVMWVGLGVDLQLVVLYEEVEILLQTSV